MRKALLRTILASGLAVIGCSKTGAGDNGRPAVMKAGGLEPAEQSIKDVMADALLLDERAVMVSEASFNALLEASERRGVSEELRLLAARAAGQTADALALGVFARPEGEGPANVDAEMFVVARNAALSPDGDIEATDFFIAAAHLSGEVEWLANIPHVAVLNGFPRGRCRDAFRGCIGQFGSRPEDLRSHRYASADEELAGLPRAVVANFEAGAFPENASSQRPMLRLYSSLNHEANEFSCHVPVEWADCEADFVPGVALPDGETLKFPEDAIVLDERDFLRALQEDGQVASEETRLTGVQLATAANAENRLGLRTYPEGGGGFDGELFVVVRNPVLNGDNIEATQHYFAVVKLRGEAAWLGRGGGMLFEPPAPSLDFGPCGPVSVTDEGPRCDVEQCVPMPPVQVQQNQPLFGNHLWPSGSRSTLRFPNGLIPTRDITTFACARWQPVPPTSPCGGPVSGGGSFVETCNGIDDNCDGQVDENDVCANRDISCPTCQTRSCQQQGLICGMASDGCGSTFSCGVCP